MIGWIIETLVATTLLMLLVLAVRAPVRKSFGPHIAYALWSMPVIRLVMPALPGDWSLTRLIAPLTQKAIDAPGMVMGVLNADRLPADIDMSVVTRIDLGAAGHHAAVALVPPTEAAGGPNLLLLLLALWAIGALAFLGYHLIAHSRFCRNLLARTRVERTVAEGRVRVIETDAAHGPLAFGVWRKYVAFPRDFSERYDELERDLALAHELGHHLRGDLLANWVALVVLAIHWFNPVAWRAFRAFRADQEIACDALVLAGRAQTLRHAYGRAIVKSAHGGPVSAACHLHTINDLKGRLKMLTTNKTSRARLIGGAAAVCVLTLAGLGLTASGTLAAETVRHRVETTTGINIANSNVVRPAPPAALRPVSAVQSPAVPVPPAPPARVGHSGESRQVTTTTTTGDDGKTVSRMKVVTIGRDGKVLTERWDSARDVPEVSSGKCPAGSAAGMVIDERRAGRRHMTICTNRIAAAAEAAADHARIAHDRAMAANDRALVANDRALASNTVALRRNAMSAALSGLQSARTSMSTNPGMTPTQRAAAVQGIEQGIAELRGDIAKVD